MNIQIYGEDPRLKPCKDYLENYSSTAVKNLILLPVPTSKDGKTILGDRASLEDVARSASEIEGGALVCYGSKEKLSSACSVVLDISSDEEYLRENARLTAYAAAGIILNQKGRAPSDLSVGIIGYGRIGQCLAKILVFFGAKVKIYTTKASVASELCDLGICGINTRGGTDMLKLLYGLDYLINTAPAKMIPCDADDILRSTSVMELASGNNIPDSIPSVRYPSLPAKYYPESAGMAMGRAVIRGIGGLVERKGS